MANMKLILTQDVRSLGHKDDEVAVRPGYGRFYGCVFRKMQRL